MSVSTSSLCCTYCLRSRPSRGSRGPGRRRPGAGAAAHRAQARGAPPRWPAPPSMKLPAAMRRRGSAERHQHPRQGRAPGRGRAAGALGGDEVGDHQHGQRTRRGQRRSAILRWMRRDGSMAARRAGNGVPGRAGELFLACRDDSPPSRGVSTERGASLTGRRKAWGTVACHGPGKSKVVNPDRQIDCIGLFCPMPIVKTREAISEMAVGQVLEMLSDDPASDADMKSWAREHRSRADRGLPGTGPSTGSWSGRRGRGGGGRRRIPGSRLSRLRRLRAGGPARPRRDAAVPRSGDRQSLGPPLARRGGARVAGSRPPQGGAARAAARPAGSSSPPAPPRPTTSPIKGVDAPRRGAAVPPVIAALCVEHISVLNACRELEKAGVTVALPAGGRRGTRGSRRAARRRCAPTPRSFRSRPPMRRSARCSRSRRSARVTRAARVPLHVDGVGALGRRAAQRGADGHRSADAVRQRHLRAARHAERCGCGPASSWRRRSWAGARKGGYRSGTENVPGAGRARGGGGADAHRAAPTGSPLGWPHCATGCMQGVLEAVPDCRVTGPLDRRLPHHAEHVVCAA